MEEKKFSFLSRREEETVKIGEKLLSSLFEGAIVALVGELGSGKTTLVKGMGRALGRENWVKSPSFVLVNEYRGNPPLYHLDLYRIEPGDLQEIGFEEYLYEKNGIMVIEWAEKVEKILPEHLRVKFEIVGREKRKIVFSPQGESYQGVVEKLKRKLKT